MLTFFSIEKDKIEVFRCAVFRAGELALHTVLAEDVSGVQASAFMPGISRQPVSPASEAP